MKILKKTLAVVLVMLSLFSTCTVAMPVFAENEDVSVAENEENIQPEIISEITEKREENVKHFMLSDGSFVVAQYNNPVHYQADSGEWIDIDNTVTETDATTEQTELFGTDELYATKKAVDNVVFAAKSNSSTLVSYEAIDYPISLNYQSAKKSNIQIIENNEELTGDEAFLTLPNVTQEVLYENVFTDVDLQYIVSPTGLKENIILKSKSAQNSFTVNYNIGELTAEVIDEHTINLMADNEIVYTISAPYMVDSNGEKSEDVTLNVDKNKNGKLRVNIVADSSWLQAEERAYPVTVDPAIIESNDSSIDGVCVTAGTTSEGDLTLSYNNSYALLNIGTVESDYFIDHVVSAELHLPIVSNSSAASTRVYLKRITEQWLDESGDVIKTNPSVGALVEDYANVSTTASKLDFDITKLYTEIENGTVGYGVKLELVKAGNLTFAVSNKTAPVLTVNYMSTCGLDMTMPMTAFDLGSAGCVYVNNYSGNLVVARDNDISTIGEEYPYDLSMVYNSFSSSETDSGWLPSYLSGFNYLYAYTAPDGTLKLFDLKEVNGVEDLYEVEDNDYGWEHLKATSFQTLTIPFVNKTLRIPLTFDAWKNNATEKYSYNLSGLQKIIIGENLDTDDATVRTIFSRERVVDSNDFYIVDGNGQKLLIQNTDTSYTVTQYNLGTDGNYSVGECVSYIYDTDGNVTEIKRGNKVEAVFEYINGRITKITDDKNHTLTFTYKEDSKRIESVTESKNNEVGQVYSFNRSINNVVTRTAGADGIFNNNDDRLVTSRFSPDLKLLGESYSLVSGEKLGAVSYERDNSGENSASASVFDDISRVGIVGKTPDNLLQNHNIESETNWTKKTIADSNATYTAGISADKSYVGLKSFKVVTTDFTKDGAAGYCQSITPATGVLEPGKKYVASAYVNASAYTKDADALSSTSYGGFVMVEIKTPSGTERKYSNPITNTGDNWERAFLTFDVPQDFTQITVGLIGRNGVGTAYFDAVQLEEGDYPGQYNMVENNGFSYKNSSNLPTSWSRYHCSTAEIVTNGRIKVTGDPDYNRAHYQEFQLNNASQEDTYTISAWGKGDSVPTLGSSSKSFGVHALVFYDGETNVSKAFTKAYKDFNYYDSQEQYLSLSFDLSHPSDASKVPTKIRVVLRYYGQLNTAYFDDVGLFRSGEVYDLSDAAPQTTEPTVSYEYYSTNGNIKTKTVTDSGNVTVYSYAEGGPLTAETVTETVTDDNGNISTITTTYTYNSNGDVVSILKPDGTGDTFVYELYDTDKTRILSKTYDDGSVYEYTYHNADIVATETVTTVNEDEESTVEVYNYDEYSNLISYTVDNVLKESYTYTIVSGEYLVATEAADGYVTAYTYNADGEITQKVKTLNGAEVEKDVYEYNSNGNYLSKHSHTEKGVTLTTHYNSDGAVTKVEHNGFAYNYTYDNFGNTTGVKVGNQSLITYSYLPDKSKLSGITYGNGDSESYTYTPYGQLLEKSVSSLGNVSYRYDNAGNLTYQKDELSDRRTYFNYDLDGNFIGQKVYVDSIGNTSANFLFSSANVYDEKNRVIRKDMQGEEYTLNEYYYYDAEDRVTKTDLTSKRNLTYSYDEQGRLSTRTLNTNVPTAEMLTYSDDGLIASHRVTDATRDNTYSYTYDDNYNITEIKQDGNIIHSYVYDESNQLIRENNSVSGKTTTFSYDCYGNILNKKEYAFTLGSLGAETDTISYSYDSTWKDKLTSYDGQSITYDAMGNPTSYRGATLTWNGRKLMSYTKDDLHITYKYDADGLRTQKTVNGVQHDYYYVDGQIAYEKVGNEYSLYYRYDQDGRLSMVIKNRLSDNYKWYFYLLSNTRGDIVAMNDAAGPLTVKYNYDAWGKVLSVTNAAGTQHTAGNFAHQIPVRYRGYYYDEETEFYYLQSRYYDPETGGFLNADDVNFIGYSGENLSYNAFAYCENNPVNGEDPTGLFYKEDHLNETYRIAKKYFSKDVAKAMGEASASVDDIYSPTKKFYSSYNQSFHFNTNSVIKKTDSRYDRSEELFKKGVSCLAKAKKYNNLYKKHSSNNNYRANFIANLSLSVLYFGMSIHPLQDQVAHSGIKGDIPVGIYLGSGSIFVFHFHWPWGVDELDKPYPKNKNKKKRDVNTEVTTKQIKRIVKMYKKYGLYSYVK